MTPSFPSAGKRSRRSRKTGWRATRASAASSERSARVSASPPTAWIWSRAPRPFLTQVLDRALEPGGELALGQFAPVVGEPDFAGPGRAFRDEGGGGENEEQQVADRGRLEEPSPGQGGDGGQGDQETGMRGHARPSVSDRRSGFPPPSRRHPRFLSEMKTWSERGTPSDMRKSRTATA